MLPRENYKWAKKVEGAGWWKAYSVETKRGKNKERKNGEMWKQNMRYEKESDKNKNKDRREWKEIT
jgi:hypothetical protein